MGPSQQVKHELEQCGEMVCLGWEDGRRSPEYRALIQPLRYKNKMYLEGTQTPIGLNERGYYMYIGPADQEISARGGAFLLRGEERYQIDRAERVTFRGETVYYWAILRNYTEAEA